MPVAEPMTAEEFLALPEPELRWAELVGGEFVVDVPILRHQLIRTEILVELALWTRGDAGDRPPYAVPDICVEVRSPSTWRYDIGAKKSGYERRGLPELWLVDTAGDEVLVFRRSSRQPAHFDVALELTRDDTLTSPLLPGFAMKLDKLFGE